MNYTNGEVGHEVGENTIALENRPVVLGAIEGHEMTMAALLAVSLSSLGLSILIHIYVKNNNSEVIAAMMREKPRRASTCPRSVWEMRLFDWTEVRMRTEAKFPSHGALSPVR